jgi:hypothetical protein
MQAAILSIRSLALYTEPDFLKRGQLLPQGVL